MGHGQWVRVWNGVRVGIRVRVRVRGIYTGRVKVENQGPCAPESAVYP